MEVKPKIFLETQRVPGEFEFVQPDRGSQSRTQYVSLCYPRISRHSHLSFLRPYTNISIPFFYVKLEPDRGGCGDLSPAHSWLSREPLSIEEERLSRVDERSTPRRNGKRSFCPIVRTIPRRFTDSGPHGVPPRGPRAARNGPQLCNSRTFRDSLKNDINYSREKCYRARALSGTSALARLPKLYL